MGYPSLFGGQMRLVRWVVIAAFTLGCPLHAGDLKPVENPKGELQRLAEIAEKWKVAVVRRDIKYLEEVTPPDWRPDAQGKLKDKESQLYRLLFKGASSPYQLFTRRDTRVETVLLPHPELKGFGEGTTVCYINTESIKPEWPIAK